MKQVKMYTDGACQGNPGPGGWGVYLICDGRKKKISGFDRNTTNNRMELMAAIKGLSSLSESCEVELYSDSSYVINGMTKWVYGWQKNCWKGANKKPVKNIELWQDLVANSKKHKVNWIWVKGHSGVEGNEIADSLAVSAISEGL